MTEEYSFPPYMETIEEAIKVFGGEKQKTYKGMDITPLWDLKGEGFSSCKYLYKAPKFEKICVGLQNFRDMLMSYALMIFPDDEHALPIFSSYWAENRKGSYFIADFYPTADLIVDIPYMEKYLEPLEDAYSKGIASFKGSQERNPNWFKALMSPYCITGSLSSSTKESQGLLLGITMEYFNIYVNLWKKDEPRGAEYMKRLNEKREAIRTNFRGKDPGGIMMVKAVGEELAELSIKTLF